MSEHKQSEKGTEQRKVNNEQVDVSLVHGYLCLVGEEKDDGDLYALTNVRILRRIGFKEVEL